MRSGHYVAYVQRGLSVSDSPQLQALLRKHGMAGPEPSSSASNSKAAPGKSTKKGPAAKAASSSSGKGSVAEKRKSAHGKQVNAVDKASNAEQADKLSGPQQPSGPALDKIASNCNRDSSAAAASSEATGAGLSVTSFNSKASAQAGSFAHTNGAVKPEQSIPEDWERSDSNSTDEPQTHTHPETASNPANGTDQQTSSTTAEASTLVPASHNPAEHANGAAEQPGSPTPDTSTGSDQASTSRHQSSLPPQQAGPTDEGPVSRKGRIGVKQESAQQEKRSWYYISDTQVKPVSEADVLSREAYILLYMRTA